MPIVKARQLGKPDPDLRAGQATSAANTNSSSELKSADKSALTAE